MDDKWIKHLEFIQSNITRMNTNSFQIKGLLFAIIPAILAIYSTTQKNLFIFIALLISIILWLVDSYYMQLERKFRGIYESVVIIINNGTPTDLPDIKPFEMPLEKLTNKKYSYFRLVFAKKMFLIHIPVMLLLLIYIGFILWNDYIKSLLN
jgi:energy-converting hydrogenase Eha subunit H